MANTVKTNINIDIDGNKIYDDACSSVLHPTSQALGLIPRAIRAAFAPLEKWLLHREYAVKEVEALLESKLQNVTPEKIVTPEPYVAIPAIQSISYSMDNEEIRDMYATLLAKAMHSSTKNSVHPSFVEAIKQMSPLDALMFKHLVRNDPAPMVHMKYIAKQGFVLLETNITGMDFSTHSSLSLSIDNLSRLNFIEIPVGESFIDTNRYQSLLNSDEYIKLTNKHAILNKDSIDPVYSIVRVTSLGRAFHSICIGQSFNS